MVSLTDARTNGKAGPPVMDLPERVGSRRRRRPELAVGIVLIVGCALAAVLLYLQSDRKMPVAAFAAEVRAGEVIDRSDLEVVYLSHDGLVATVSPTGAARFVGQRAARDVGRGALLTPDVVSGGAVLPKGEGVVGVPVSRASSPSPTMATGDVVNVVLVGDAAEVVERAVIHGVEELEDGSGWSVALRTTTAGAVRIASVDPQRVRLVLVGE